VAGYTATIDVALLREQWASHIPIAQICSNFTVTRDQMTRLKFVFDLPPRHDRRLRYKPPRTPKPGDAEELASQSSLSLAPQIAERVTLVQSLWTSEMRFARQVNKSGAAFSLRHIRVDDLVDRFLGDEEEPIVEID
jgi:hypothetical protein